MAKPSSGAERLNAPRDVSIYGTYRALTRCLYVEPLMEFKNAFFHVSMSLLLKSEAAAGSDITLSSSGDSIVVSLASLSTLSLPGISTWAGIHCKVRSMLLLSSFLIMWNM